jgi:hypothetical protein
MVLMAHALRQPAPLLQSTIFEEAQALNKVFFFACIAKK